jgi:hypothetical protein
MADGQVVFEINGDAKGINQTVKQVTSNIQSESKKWDQAANDSTGKIEDSFAKMAGNIVGSLTAAGIGAILLNWGKAAVDAASDLSEVQNVVDTVFGEGARTIDSWAKNAGQQFGLTETQAKKFTSTLGAMMKSSGLAGNEIVNMSTDLAGLAADMASFYNLDFETAFEKIRSGISGETMPLKQLGINMSVANLEAFALAQGLEKTFSQMDQGEQTMLRYQYLMQATSDAQGDFAKTADGFANAQRRIESSIDSIKTSIGNILLPWVEKAVSGIAGFLSQIAADMMPEKTVLDEFNEIDVDTTQKMADLEETYAKAEAIIKLIDEIQKQTVTLNDGSTVTFEELFKDLGNIEANGGDVRGYLEGLGVDVDYVIQKYNVWKESTRQLTSLIPSLSSVIDSETGAINGGTDALQRNLDEWKANEDKKLAWAAYYAKARALEEKKAQLWLYDFEARLARIKAEEARKALKEKWGAEFDEQGNISSQDLWSNTPLLAGKKSDEWAADVLKYNQTLDNQKKAEEELERQTNDFVSAQEDLGRINNSLTDEFGELTEEEEYAADAVEEWGEESKKAGKEAVTAAESALKALADYVQGVKDGTEQAVNSILKGFEKVGKAGDENREKSNELATQEADTLNKYTSVWAKWGSDNASLKKMAASWDSLSKEEQSAYEELVKIRNAQKEVNDALGQYSPEGMKNGLQSQIDYMTEYLDNLKKAQEMGLSNELLASLSDGSQESAEYLANLVEAGPEAAQAVDELYQEVQAQKKEFTDALTEQKLAADQTYDALVQKALETVDELNLGDEAEAAMGETVSGLAQGIADHVGEVQAAVDAIEEQLNRLSAFGFSFNLDGGGWSFSLDGEHETGLDYVPFDGYLAGLHEGEGILTAEENRIWQRFKNGQASTGNVDYDALGGVMRDNVKAGGDVYLDGRTVGQVISAAQGRSYRALQRSGWQG